MASSSATAPHAQQQQQQQGGAHKKLNTILVARPNNQRPSELELQLRLQCQKMRVHKQLSGAHMIFPQENGLALRVYYPHELATHDDDETVDALAEFAVKFQWAITLFIMPAIDGMESRFYRRAMQLECSPRIFVVSNTQEALDAFFFFCQTIRRPQLTRRDQFFEKVRTEEFCHHDDDDDTASGMPEYSKVIHCFHDLADRWGFEREEGVLILRHFGTLSNLELGQLESVPVEARTKRLLVELFNGEDEIACKRILEEQTHGQRPPEMIEQVAIPDYASFPGGLEAGLSRGEHQNPGVNLYDPGMAENYTVHRPHPNQAGAPNEVAMNGERQDPPRTNLYQQGVAGNYTVQQKQHPNQVGMPNGVAMNGEYEDPRTNLYVPPVAGNYTVHHNPQPDYGSQGTQSFHQPPTNQAQYADQLIPNHNNPPTYNQAHSLKQGANHRNVYPTAVPSGHQYQPPMTQPRMATHQQAPQGMGFAPAQQPYQGFGRSGPNDAISGQAATRTPHAQTQLPYPSGGTSQHITPSPQYPNQQSGANIRHFM